MGGRNDQGPTWLVDGAVRIRRLTVGAYGNNAYVVACPSTGDALLIDAADEPDRLLAALADVRCRAIVLTHGHSDHWQALEAVRRAYPHALVGIHPADAGLLPPPPLPHALADGEPIPIGDLTVTVVHTPGHTPGSVCLSVPGYLFSGDTLFPGGPGATRPPLGDFPQIIASIRERCVTLPDATIVLPGHGESTTIGLERPHLEDWAARGW